MAGITISIVVDDKTKEHVRESIQKIASMVNKYFADGIMTGTLGCMREKALPGEEEGNCHNVALSFIGDLAMAGKAQGWFWVQGENSKMKQNGKPWEHSWLEFDNFVVDATMRDMANPNEPGIVIGEKKFYYKARGITKVISRKDPGQTRRWVLRKGSK